MSVMNKQKFWIIILGTYLLCYSFRIFEYFVLRTDQTWVGEAIVHKCLGIVVLLVVSMMMKLTLSQVGFVKEKAFSNLIKGLALGCGVFVLAYGVEIVLVISQGSFQSLQLYVSTYAVNQNAGHQTELFFFLLCIIGNIVNVIMEEGIFRGLFMKLMAPKYSFAVSACLSSCLFGFWHMIGPIRNYMDGMMSMSGMLAYIAMLVGTSALVGFKFAMLTQMTGSLFMSMGDHFVNNTIVNLLHVISDEGIDELMFVRITIAQSLSFMLVFVCFIRRGCKHK